MEHDEGAWFHLLEQVGAGSDAAFAELYTRTAPQLYALCLHLLGHWEGA
jgi:DNA-directed RNA polymerase specialized sigma24 family protein